MNANLMGRVNIRNVAFKLCNFLFQHKRFQTAFSKADQEKRNYAKQVRVNNSEM